MTKEKRGKGKWKRQVPHRECIIKNNSSPRFRTTTDVSTGNISSGWDIGD